MAISTLTWNYWSGGDPVTATAIGVRLIVALTLLVGATFALTRSRQGRRAAPLEKLGNMPKPFDA